MSGDPAVRVRLPKVLRGGVTAVIGILLGSVLTSCGSGSELSSGSAETCSPVVFFGVRGSGEFGDQQEGIGSTIKAVRERLSSDLAPTALTTVPVDYPALSVFDYLKNAPFNATAYRDSVDNGRQQLVNALYLWHGRCRSSRFVLAGYSQGAQVVADTLAGEDRSPGRNLQATNNTDAEILSQIDGVALFGDPRYNPQDPVDAFQRVGVGGIFAVAAPLGNGGKRPLMPSAPRMQSYCLAGDPVCNADPVTEARRAEPCLAQQSSCVHFQYLGATAIRAADWLAGRLNERLPSPTASTHAAQRATDTPCATYEHLSSDDQQALISRLLAEHGHAQARGDIDLTRASVQLYCNTHSADQPIGNVYKY